MAMSKRTCSIEGCEKAFKARTWCAMHYRRWRIHGDPLGGRDRYNNPKDAWEARTEWRGECLEWTGARTANGYGLFSVSGELTYTHRYAWEQANGPIPAGAHIDHICHNPACCNHTHLRAVTVRQNMRNRSGAEAGAESGARNVHRAGRKWEVRIKKDGARHYYGTYQTVEEAAVVAEQKRKELFGEYAGKG